MKPTVHAIHVSWSAGTVLSTGFSSVTPAAYTIADTRHSAMPTMELEEPGASEGSANPTTMEPANATASPARRRVGRPSRRNTPAKMPRKIGPVLTSMEAVPASTWRSASLSARLYAPNHSRPAATMNPKSRRLTGTQPRVSRSAPSATEPTNRRPSAIEPGENVSATSRMPTNADAHRMTLTLAAANARRPVPGGLRDRRGRGHREQYNTASLGSVA